MILAAAGAQTPAAGPVRGFGSTPEHCWAVGNGGLVLRSDDGGATWRPCPAPGRINFQAVACDKQTVFLFGGRGISGHPRGAGAGAIFRTDDKGNSFQPVDAGRAGWLYGGAFHGSSAVVFGEATGGAPAGMWRSVSGGKTWQPIAADTAGWLLGGRFSGARSAFLVGRTMTIISLRDMKESAFRPLPRSSATEPLKSRHAATTGATPSRWPCP